MRNRKTHKRICAGCNKEELVRSDQLNKKCATCAKNVSGLKRYHKEHPEAAGNASRKHGLRNHRIYRIYKSMLERCGHTSVVHKFACHFAHAVSGGKVNVVKLQEDAGIVSNLNGRGDYLGSL